MRLPIARTITGPAGAAGQLTLPDPSPWPATVATWHLECPRQSPAWDQYLLAMLHLRPVEGMAEPKLRFPEATHEILLAALDPQAEPRRDDPETWVWLEPVNMAEQIAVPSDEVAAEVLAQCAQAVVGGELWAEPPLSGQREPWHSFAQAAAVKLGGTPAPPPRQAAG